MNTLLAWFNSPEWMIVVKTLLHTLWQTGGLALLLWIALRRVANPAARYRLTLGTLAAILGTTLLTWAVLNQSTAKPAAPDFASQTTLTRKPSGVSPSAHFGEPSVIAYATPIAKPAEETRWSGWLALAWLLGTALMLTRAGIQVAGAERLRRSCKPLDDSRITQLLTEAQRALNLTRRIRVAVTDKLTSPAVVGVIVPTLILPLTLLTTLTPEQIRFILLHELAHIRRGDYFANLFQLFIEALLFFNPAVWWISHQVRREREACCDALAIELSGAPVDYARTLLHVAETVLNPPPAVATAFSDNQREPSSLTDRVQRLLIPGYRPALRLTWRAMLAAIVVGGTLLFLSAVGARNVVGAVSTNSSEKVTEPATNVVENANDKTQSPSSDVMGRSSRNTAGDFNIYRWLADEPVGTNPVNIFLKPRFGIVPRGIIYGASLTTNPSSSLNSKSAAGRITLSNYSNSHAPVVQLGTPSQPDTEAVDGFVFSYSGDDGTNTQPFQPLESRVFTIDLNKYAAAVRKLAGLPESTPLSSTYPLFRMFLTNAGVSFDPALGKTFFLSDSRGDVYVRATKDELDAVERLIQPLAGVPLTHRTIHISPEALAKATHTLPREISPVLATNTVAGLRALLESFDPSDPRPKHVQYNPETGEITARATEADLKKFETALHTIQSTNAPRAIKNSQIHTGKGRQAISNKLDQITFDRISFPLQPWTNVIKSLSAEVRKLDPDKRGVNLILNPNSAATAVSTNAQPPKPAPEPPLVYVSVQPELTNATLRQVLNAIVKSADKPIVYHIEEYAVVISLKGNEIVPLEIRTFHVVPETFLQSLDAATGLLPDFRSTNGVGGGQNGLNGLALTRTNSMEIVHAAVRKFFATLGVKLDPAVGKTVFFNDREGSLLVRATSEELDTIEQSIRVMNTKLPQVNIKIRWVEIPKKLVTSAWLNAASNAFLLPLSDAKNHSSLLTKQEMTDVIRRIERRDGFNLFNEAQVTTLTERQAQISISEAKTVVTGINPKALTKPGVVSTNKDASAFLEIESTPLGPVFDVLPTVSADEDTISLHMISTLTEFLGYNKAPKEIPIYVDGKKTKTTLPLPKYRVYQMTNDTVVPDGRTLLLSNFSITETAKQPNGEMRTTDVTSTQTNLLFILITPTVIDPAGNRAKPAPILNR